jgi:hypothetical protein
MHGRSSRLERMLSRGRARRCKGTHAHTCETCTDAFTRTHAFARGARKQQRKTSSLLLLLLCVCVSSGFACAGAQPPRTWAVRRGRARSRSCVEHGAVEHAGGAPSASHACVGLAACCGLHRWVNGRCVLRVADQGRCADGRDDGAQERRRRALYAASMSAPS